MFVRALSLFTILCFAPTICFGQSRPQESLDEDLSGPRVEWIGMIAERIPADDEICLVLDRSRDRGGYPIRGDRFIVCHGGAFEDQSFALSREMRVTGNLGARMPRRIGDKVIDAALIAAPIIELLPQSYSYAWPEPWRYPRYRHDPFYDPYWGGWHLWYWRRW